MAAGNLSASQAVEPGRRERAAAISVPFKGCDCCYSLHRNGLAVAVSIDRGGGGVQAHPILRLFSMCFQAYTTILSALWVRLKGSRNLIIELIILAFYEGER